MKFNWILLAIWLTVLVHCRSIGPRCPLPIECHPKPIETLQHPIRCCGNEKSYFIKIIFFFSCLSVIIAVRVDAALFVCLCCVGRCWWGGGFCRLRRTYVGCMPSFMTNFAGFLWAILRGDSPGLFLSLSFWLVPNCRRPSKWSLQCQSITVMSRDQSAGLVSRTVCHAPFGQIACTKYYRVSETSFLFVRFFRLCSYKFGPKQTKRAKIISFCCETFRKSFEMSVVSLLEWERERKRERKKNKNLISFYFSLLFFQRGKTNRKLGQHFSSSAKCKVKANQVFCVRAEMSGKNNRKKSKWK